MRTILIADDEVDLRYLITLTLQFEEYTLLEAADGETAWQMITTCQPDLVLLDVLMPGRDGVELVRAIRNEPALPQPRIVMLSALHHEPLIHAALAAGADFFLTKPFSPRALLSLVDELMGSSSGTTGK